MSSITQRGGINPETAGGLNLPPMPGGHDAPLPPGGAPTGQPVPLGPDGKPIPPAAVPTALGTTTTNKTGKPGTTPIFNTDSVERSTDSAGFDSSLGTPPSLPESESILGNTNGQSDFKAFVGQAMGIKDLLLQPGAVGQINTRAQGYINNPGSSVLGQIFGEAGGSQVTGQVSTSVQETVADIGASLPASLQPAFNQLMGAVQNSPIAANPMTLAAFAEASADYLICMAAALNTTDSQKNKDFMGQVLSTSQAAETAKESQIDTVMVSASEKTQAQKDEQAAADRNKVWNIVLAVVMIVVAVVLAVVAVITCFTGVGEALIGAVAASVLAATAAIAAVVMAVITIIQQLPTILEACGVNCDGFRKLLAGPFGKFLQVLTYVCIACELLYAGVGIASAIGGTATAAVSAGAQAGAKAAQTAIQTGIQAGLQNGLTLADATAQATAGAVSETAAAIAQAAPSLSTTVVNTMAQSTCNAVGASMSASISAAGGTMAGMSADAVAQAATTAIAAGVKAGTSAASSTLVTVLNGSAQALGAAGKVASGINQMTEAQIDFQIAELGADVQEMQAKLKLVQTELQSNQDQTKNVEDDLKEVMTIAQNIMQKLFSAMNSQSDIVQTVGAFGKKG